MGKILVVIGLLIIGIAQLISYLNMFIYATGFFLMSVGSNTSSKKGSNKPYAKIFRDFKNKE